LSFFIKTYSLPEEDALLREEAGSKCQVNKNKKMMYVIGDSIARGRCAFPIRLIANDDYLSCSTLAGPEKLKKTGTRGLTWKDSMRHYD
jgi:hypothetical protein